MKIFKNDSDIFEFNFCVGKKCRWWKTWISPESARFSESGDTIRYSNFGHIKKRQIFTIQPNHGLLLISKNHENEVSSSSQFLSNGSKEKRFCQIKKAYMVKRWVMTVLIHSSLSGPTWEPCIWQDFLTRKLRNCRIAKFLFLCMCDDEIKLMIKILRTHTCKR